MMRVLRHQLGMSLIEVTLSLAITGLVAVPLTSIISAQLRIPAKISSNVVASRQIQRTTLVLIEDAQAAESFAVGSDPDYGTFSWKELAGPAPVELTARMLATSTNGTVWDPRDQRCGRAWVSCLRVRL